MRCIAIFIASGRDMSRSQLQAARGTAEQTLPSRPPWSMCEEQPGGTRQRARRHSLLQCMERVGSQLLWFYIGVLEYPARDQTILHCLQLRHSSRACEDDQPVVLVDESVGVAARLTYFQQKLLLADHMFTIRTDDIEHSPCVFTERLAVVVTEHTENSCTGILAFARPNWNPSAAMQHSCRLWNLRIGELHHVTSATFGLRNR